MPESQRDRYLAALAEHLPFPPEQRAEVLEEISSHLDDAVAAGLERRKTADRAETDAQARLGPPRDLARELARPEQTTRRLLAAAGAGVLAGIGPGLYGFVCGALLLTLAMIGLAGLAQLTNRLLDTGWTLLTADGGWNSVLLAGSLALGLFFAGRAATNSVAMTSRRLYLDVRLYVAVTGTLLGGFVLTFLVAVPQNAASVTALSLAPLAFALGSMRPELLPRSFRGWWLVVGALVVFVPLLGLSVTSGTSESGLGVPEAAWERRVEAAGPWWAGADQPGDLLASGGWSTTGDATRVDWQLTHEAAAAPLSDLRVEAWRADSGGFGSLDTRFREPFAVAPVTRDRETLTAEVVTTREPGVSHWVLVLTGVGPDGVRYVLYAGSGGSSTFTGSVRDWIVAIAD